MPARAGAAAGAKARQKKAVARKEKLEAKEAAEAAAIEQFITTYDTDKTGSFDREECRALLTAVVREAMGDPTAEVRDELLDKTMSYADKSGDGQIEREHVMLAVKRYKALIKHDAELHTLFDAHDKDKSGALGRDEVLSLLTDVASTMEHKHVDEADVDFVLERCDDDKSGSVSFDELGPAIATWKECAKDTPPEPEAAAKSSACVVL